MNKIIWIIFGVMCLAGCGSTPKKTAAPPAPVVLNQNLTLHDVCTFVEDETFKAGQAKIDGVRERKYTNELTTTFPIVLLPDVMSSIEAVYHLPIEDEDDAAAYANLVYKQCMAQNR